MRVAILSDIHGNLHALEAVFDDLERQRADRVIVAGDMVIGAPDAVACCRFVIERGLAAVCGNHERYLLAAAAGDPAFAPLNWQPARWTAARFSEAQLAALVALPSTVSIEGPPGLLVTHSAPHDDYAFVTPDTSDSDLREHFGDVGSSTAVRGHYHRAFERRLGGFHLISVGSVGLPLSGSVEAEYALLEPDGEGGWSAEHRSVPYDLEATLRSFETSGYLEEAGPVARLFREEVATGSRLSAPPRGDFMNIAPGTSSPTTQAEFSGPHRDSSPTPSPPWR